MGHPIVGVSIPFKNTEAIVKILFSGIPPTVNNFLRQTSAINCHGALRRLEYPRHSLPT